MNLHELERRLRRGFDGPLPGPPAQLLLAPRPRKGWQPGELPDDARSGAALLLLYPRRSRMHVLLTVRDGGLPQHAGQVSLPGGACEPGESPAQAALREAHEEVGLDRERVEVVGELSPLHIPVSGFAVHPFVALAERRPDWVPEAREVARILEPPLADLMDRQCLGLESRPSRIGLREIPFFRVDDEKVWGATAMILAEFLCLIGYRPEIWSRG